MRAADRVPRVPAALAVLLLAFFSHGCAPTGSFISRLLVVDEGALRTRPCHSEHYYQRQ